VGALSPWVYASVISPGHWAEEADWRLSIEKAEVIVLGVDEVIMNNDEAAKRQGVEPTYKRLKGFGALQMTWGRYVVAAAGHDGLLEASKIIDTYHDRGQDELLFRALKEFASETLPFKRFNQNAAWYYLMVTAFFLFESFKEDMAKPVIPVSAYAPRVRRATIDFAAKLVRHAGKTILKVTQATWDAIQLPELWARSGSPPQFTWA